MPSEYKNSYERLVGELGVEGAKQEMKRRRGLVKHHKGGSFNDPEFARKASKMRGKREASHPGDLPQPQ